MSNKSKVVTIHGDSATVRDATIDDLFMIDTTAAHSAAELLLGKAGLFIAGMAFQQHRAPRTVVVHESTTLKSFDCNGIKSSMYVLKKVETSVGYFNPFSPL